jgi:protein-L-isoaspartate O-methyltransferase
MSRYGGGGAQVVGVDLSHAVLTARSNLASHGRRARVAQADLFRMPLREGTFDIVYSIGVLTTRPRRVTRFARRHGAKSALGIEGELLARSGRPTAGPPGPLT